MFHWSAKQRVFKASIYIYIYIAIQPHMPLAYVYMQSCIYIYIYMGRCPEYEYTSHDLAVRVPSFEKSFRVFFKMGLSFFALSFLHVQVSVCMSQGCNRVEFSVDAHQL